MAKEFPWKEAPELPPPVEGEDGEQEPKRQRKERSDKGVPRGEGAPRRRRNASLEEPIGGMLTMFNLPLNMVAPTDALDPAEIVALARALDEQCKRSPRFRRYVERMLGVASGGQLIAVAGMIGARRMARHGFFGDGGPLVDAAIGSQLGAMTGETPVTPEYAKRAEAPQSGSAMEAPGEGIPAPAIGGVNIESGFGIG